MKTDQEIQQILDDPRNRDAGFDYWDWLETQTANERLLNEIRYRATRAIHMELAFHDYD